LLPKTPKTPRYLLKIFKVNLKSWIELMLQ